MSNEIQKQNENIEASSNVDKIADIYKNMNEKEKSEFLNELKNQFAKDDKLNKLLTNLYSKTQNKQILELQNSIFWKKEESKTEISETQNKYNETFSKDYNILQNTLKELIKWMQDVQKDMETNTGYYNKMIDLASWWTWQKSYESAMANYKQQIEKSISKFEKKFGLSPDSLNKKSEQSNNELKIWIKPTEEQLKQYEMLLGQKEILLNKELKSVQVNKMIENSVDSLKSWEVTNNAVSWVEWLAEWSVESVKWVVWWTFDLAKLILKYEWGVYWKILNNIWVSKNILKTIHLDPDYKDEIDNQVKSIYDYVEKNWITWVWKELWNAIWNEFKKIWELKWEEQAKAIWNLSWKIIWMLSILKWWMSIASNLETLSAKWSKVVELMEKWRHLWKLWDISAKINRAKTIIQIADVISNWVWESLLWAVLSKALSSSLALLKEWWALASDQIKQIKQTISQLKEAKSTANTEEGKELIDKSVNALEQWLNKANVEIKNQETWKVSENVNKWEAKNDANINNEQEINILRWKNHKFVSSNEMKPWMEDAIWYVDKNGELIINSEKWKNLSFSEKKDFVAHERNHQVFSRLSENRLNSLISDFQNNPQWKWLENHWKQLMWKNVSTEPKDIINEIVADTMWRLRVWEINDFDKQTLKILENYPEFSDKIRELKNSIMNDSINQNLDLKEAAKMINNLNEILNPDELIVYLRLKYKDLSKFNDEQILEQIKNNKEKFKTKEPLLDVDRILSNREELKNINKEYEYLAKYNPDTIYQNKNDIDNKIATLKWKLEWANPEKQAEIKNKIDYLENLKTELDNKHIAHTKESTIKHRESEISSKYSQWENHIYNYQESDYQRTLNFLNEKLEWADEIETQHINKLKSKLEWKHQEHLEKEQKVIKQQEKEWKIKQDIENNYKSLAEYEPSNHNSNITNIEVELNRLEEELNHLNSFPTANQSNRTNIEQSIDYLKWLEQDHNSKHENFLKQRKANKEIETQKSSEYISWNLEELQNKLAYLKNQKAQLEKQLQDDRFNLYNERLASNETTGWAKRIVDGERYTNSAENPDYILAKNKIKDIDRDIHSLEMKIKDGKQNLKEATKSEKVDNAINLNNNIDELAKQKWITNDQARLELANQNVFGWEMKEEWGDAIIKAHEVNNWSESIWNYWTHSLGEKMKILQNAGISKEQAKELIFKGYCWASEKGFEWVDISKLEQMIINIGKTPETILAELKILEKWLDNNAINEALKWLKIWDDLPLAIKDQLLWQICKKWNFFEFANNNPELLKLFEWWVNTEKFNKFLLNQASKIEHFDLIWKNTKWPLFKEQYERARTEFMEKNWINIPKNKPEIIKSTFEKARDIFYDSNSSWDELLNALNTMKKESAGFKSWDTVSIIAWKSPESFSKDKILDFIKNIKDTSDIKDFLNSPNKKEWQKFLINDKKTEIFEKNGIKTYKYGDYDLASVDDEIFEKFEKEFEDYKKQFPEDLISALEKN